ncbi:MAG TPA: exodeoxyribonuclease VII large subunit [Thermoanaerobaculia bacterium]|nr:exodeoxyribonuclease VII large subunit [Thermoanaerobaculia bacterium]
MTLPLFEPTYSVSVLCAEIRDLLGEAFGAVWVAGEAQRVRLSSRGHLYFELIEKGERDEVAGKLEAVVWKTDWLRLRRMLGASGQEIADGLMIRCRAALDFYGPGGRLQLTVKEIDPVFSLGHLERRRRETLQGLEAAGLLERNRSLFLADLPLKIALVTSEGSAAFHDFLSGLRESGYGFQVLFFHAAVQGKEAEREIVSALAALAGLDLDAVVLIRGGGSRSDLAVFDGRAVAEAVARAAVPVLTGLGHEIDQAIADVVAHTALKTPTKVAEFLIERMARQEALLLAAERRLGREAEEPLLRARERLGRAERGIALGRMRLAAFDRRLDEVARTLAQLGRGRVWEASRRSRAAEVALVQAAPVRLARNEAARRASAERLAGAARAKIREVAARLSGIERLCASLGPERTLERGFSITRDAKGVLLRDPAGAAAGDRLTTRLARGTLISRVEEA